MCDVNGDVARELKVNFMPDGRIKPAACYLTASSCIEPRFYSHHELEKVFSKCGMTQSSLENHLKRLALLPWLTITRVKDGFQFAVDSELKTLCERG